MRIPTNIPETPMGETDQDSFFKSKEKFQQQLQDIFQTILRLTGPDQFDQLCQWLEYNQYCTIDDFYDSSYNDPEKFDTKGPATEYKWKGKMNHLSPIVAQKLKCFVRWMTHEDRHYELHDEFLATLTRDNYLKFRHMHSLSFSTSSPSHHEPSTLKTSFSGESKHQTPSESQTALNNYKKGPQRKAFFSQQEEISDDDEYANAEEQFSTDPEPEEHSPYSVYQSSFHPKMPQKSFPPPNIWETPSESTQQMIIEHNKKVKLNNPTPYPSGSKTKPNLTLGKPTPAPQQVHQHSQDEPTEEPPPDPSTQTLVKKCLAESGIDPTDIQNVMPVSYAKRNISPHESSRQIQTHHRYVFARVNQSKHHNCDDLDPTDTPIAVLTALQAPSDDTYNPKCTHSLMEIQCNHSQYPILMKKKCTHNPSASQVSKSYHPNPVTFPYPPDPGEHVLETSSAPTTLVERDKLDVSSLIPSEGEMECSFSWTCPFKSPTSSTSCFGEPTLGKLNQETDFYMTKPVPKPSSGANRVSVCHSSLVTKEHFYGENFIHDFPKSWKHIKEVDWGDKLKLNYTTYGYMLMEIDWGGKFNYTSCGHPIANWQGHETHSTGHKTSEVDRGGHDPNGSDNPPPMSIINLDDLLGRTFLLPMDQNGERKRATISEHVKDLCQQQVSREDQPRFKLKIDGDQLDDLISYNQLMEYIEDKTDTGPLEDGLYRFKCIKDHKGPYTSSDPEYNGSSYNLLIEWEPGEQTWEPLSNIIASDPYTCAVYAKEHNLLNTPRWKLLKRHARTARRLIRTLKKSKYRQARASRKYKHGCEVPRDYAHALQLDIHNGNNKWKEAIDLEIEQIKEYQVFTDVGNEYLQALTREKLNIVGGPEFEELQGHVLVMYKALYGTRLGGACWHDKFLDILHHMGFKTSEVDWGGQDPNPNHVSESLLSEVDWGAHNPDADDPEQLTGESIQSFLTFIVQLQWLVALGRHYLHKSLPCPSLW